MDFLQARPVSPSMRSLLPRQELRGSKNDELPKGAEGEQQITCFIVASRQLCIAVSAETPTSVECFWSGRVN